MIHGRLTESSVRTHGALTEDSRTEGKGREGKGSGREVEGLPRSLFVVRGARPNPNRRLVYGRASDVLGLEMTT